MKKSKTINNQIDIGSPEFWTHYDRFVAPESLKLLVENPDYPEAKRMRRITTAAHKARTIHRLKRLEKGWEINHAWLALQHANIQRHDGAPWLLMQAGDVIVVEHGWDRDVIVTHSPWTEHVSGYLLSGKWKPMVGLFLPLYDKKTILSCVEMRLAQNVVEAREKTLNEAEDWNWYQ